MWAYTGIQGAEIHAAAAGTLQGDLDYEAKVSNTITCAKLSSPRHWEKWCWKWVDRYMLIPERTLLQLPDRCRHVEGLCRGIDGDLSIPTTYGGAYRIDDFRCKITRLLGAAIGSYEDERLSVRLLANG